MRFNENNKEIVCVLLCQKSFNIVIHSYVYEPILGIFLGNDEI